MVSTAALIIVLSVFNGFEGLVQSLYGDFYADLKIVPATGKYITVDDNLVNKIKSVNGVKQLSFVAEEKAVLVNGDYQTIAFLKGVDKNYNQCKQAQSLYNVMVNMNSVQLKRLQLLRVQELQMR